MTDDQFDQFVDEWLSFFNKKYAEAGMPIRDRPFAATLAFIRHAIADTNIPPDKIEKPPFIGQFHKIVYTWYEKRYGDALTAERRSAPIQTYILIENIPFRVEVPRVLEEPAEEFHKWIIFPEEIFPYEKPDEWIVNRPATLEPGQAAEMEATLRDRALTLRRLYTKRMLVPTDKSSQMLKLCDDIPAHLESFVREMVTHYAVGISNGVWELHLAIEKAFKLALLQQGRSFRRSHDLEYLHGLLGAGISKSVLTKFPRFDFVAKYRYGEHVLHDLSQLDAYYVAAITVVLEVILSIKTSLTTKGSPRLKIVQFLNENYRNEELHA